jgi:hypothetical protein
VGLTWKAHWQKIKGHIFTSDDNVQEATIQQFRQQPKEFFARGIHKLVHECDSCLNACSDIYDIKTKKTHLLVSISYVIAQCTDMDYLKLPVVVSSHCCNTFTHES